MKHLPDPQLSFEPLTRMLYGAIPSRLLLAAIELDVFSHLTQPLSAEALAPRMHASPERARPFLDALVANDLLEKRAGRYGNTPIAEAFLVKGRPTYLGDVFLNISGYMQPAFEALTALVQARPAPPGEPRQPGGPDPETQIYANYQRAGRAQQAAAMISELPEFPRMRRMLDLGAGAGLIGLAIVAAHPTMTGVLFDRPDVVQVAQQYIHEYDLADRVTTIGGDYAVDPIGDGYDLIWSSYTLNFQRGNLDPIMHKIRAALTPGGVYVSMSEGLTQDRTKPATLVNSMLAHSLAGSELTFDDGEIAQAMLRAGFRSVHSRHAASPCWHGPVVVDIARP
ncbi:MAG: methyltransferase [Phycisphaerae bacterium]|jgi:predicted O-methyltransferase YrrM